MIACWFAWALWVFVLDAIFGTSVKSVHLNFYHIFDDPPSFPFRITFDGSGLAWLVSLLFYAGATPSLSFAIRFPAATAVKRLHDRNKSGWWIVPFFTASILLGKVRDWLGDSYPADFLMFVMIALSLWGFAEMLGLRGTSGPNRFGPDPLAPRQSRPGTQPRIGTSFANWNLFRAVPADRRGPHVKRRHG